MKQKKPPNWEAFPIDRIARLHRFSPNHRRLLNQELDKNQDNNNGVGVDRVRSHHSETLSVVFSVLLGDTIPCFSGFVNSENNRSFVHRSTESMDSLACIRVHGDGPVCWPVGVVLYLAGLLGADRCCGACATQYPGVM